MVEARTGPGIIFVDRRDTARQVSASLSEALGYEVPWVTAERPDQWRQDLAKKMREGAVRVVVSTSAWSTGVDIPRLEYVVLTGVMEAPIGLLQSVGRTMRTAKGKAEYEIINLAEPGIEHKAEKRERVLKETGFDVEKKDFLVELDEPPPEPEEFTGRDALAAVFGPKEFWFVVFGIIGIRLIWMACTGQ